MNQMGETDCLYNNRERKQPKYTKCNRCGTFNKQDIGEVCWTCNKGTMI